LRKAWPFAFYFTYFAGVAFIFPFTVLFYQSLGFSGTQIGILTGLGPLITLLSAPFWTGLADTTLRHRLIMSVVMLVGIVVIIAIPLLTTFAPVLLLVCLLNIFFAPTSSFADSATMHILADQKEMYGRLRLGGTIGFGVVAPIAGMLVQNYGLKMAFWGAAAFYFMAFIFSQKLVYSPSQATVSMMNGIRILLTDRRWIYFLILALTGGLSIAVTNNYLFVYLKELGANETTMGWALTIGTICEVPVLFFANHLIKRFKSYGLMILSMIITGIRLLLFAASNTPNELLLLQLLNGLTFPAMWMAGVSYADENAPEGLRTTAQGLFGAASFGVGMAIGGFFGGLLVESIGGRGMYLVSGSVVLATVAIITVIGWRQLAEPGVLPEIA
jgi:PPP family 3-phenylpropionic acid transporter